MRVGLGEEPEIAVLQALQLAERFDRRRAPEAPAAGLWLESIEFGRLLAT